MKEETEEEEEEAEEVKEEKRNTREAERDRKRDIDQATMPGSEAGRKQTDGKEWNAGEREDEMTGTLNIPPLLFVCPKPELTQPT